jgi:hypothetical protein
MCKEYIIWESELPWWFFWIHPSDNCVFEHYGYVCYGGIPPKRYWKYIRSRYSELI